MKNKLLLVGLSCFSLLIGGCKADPSSTDTTGTTAPTDDASTGTTDTTGTIDNEETAFHAALGGINLNYTLTYEDDYGEGYYMVTEKGTLSGIAIDYEYDFYNIALFEGYYYSYRIISDTAVEVNTEDTAWTLAEYEDTFKISTALAYSRFSYEGIDDGYYWFYSDDNNVIATISELTDCWIYLLFGVEMEVELGINVETREVIGNLYAVDDDMPLATFAFEDVGTTTIPYLANISEIVFNYEYVSAEIATELENAFKGLGTNFTLVSNYGYSDYYTDYGIYYGYEDFQYGFLVGNDDIVYEYDYFEGVFSLIGEVYNEDEETIPGDELADYLNIFYALADYFDGSTFYLTDIDGVYETKNNDILYIFAEMMAWGDYVTSVTIELTDEAFAFSLYDGEELLESFEVINVGTTTIPWIEAFLA